MAEPQSNLALIILLVATVGLIPLAIVTMTGFLKIAVVLFLIRNALGVQQTPPNLVLYGIALILATYVTAPLIGEIGYQFQNAPVQLNSVEDLRDISERVRVPLQSHLAKYATMEVSSS